MLLDPGGCPDLRRCLGSLGLTRVLRKGGIHKCNRGPQHDEALPHSHVRHRAVPLGDTESGKQGQGKVLWPSLSVATKPKAPTTEDSTPLLQGSGLPGKMDEGYPKWMLMERHA